MYKGKNPIDLSVLDVFREMGENVKFNLTRSIMAAEGGECAILLGQNSHNANACKEYIQTNRLTLSAAISC